MAGRPRRKHPIGSRQTKEKELLGHIQRVYQASKRRYGSPRIGNELQLSGIKASRNRVARLMSKENLKSIIHKKYRIQTTDSTHSYPIAENRLGRDFQASELGQKWVSDITYIATNEGWLYLTAILDLADRKVVGWSLADNMKASATTIPAWQMAIKNRPVSKPLLFHRPATRSDRGVQYACNEFRDQFKGYPILQSMSRKGNCRGRGRLG